MADSSNPLEWVEYAKGDFQYACMGVETYPRGAAYMFAQSGEKYLKAVLLHLGLMVPFTHDTLTLLGLIPQSPPKGTLEWSAAALIARVAMPTRYPGDVDQPTPEEARALERAARESNFHSSLDPHSM